MAWTEVGTESDVSIGDMKCFEIDDIEILVYHLKQGWYATANMCTHQDCALSDGYIEDDEIICDCHGGAFQIPTGNATRMPCVVPVETFPVRIRNGQIEIDFA